MLWRSKRCSMDGGKTNEIRNEVKCAIGKLETQLNGSQKDFGDDHQLTNPEKMVVYAGHSGAAHAVCGLPCSAMPNGRPCNRETRVIPSPFSDLSAPFP